MSRNEIRKMLQTETITRFRKLNANALASQKLASSPLPSQISKSTLSLVVKRVCPVLGVTGTAYHVLDILLGLVKEKDLGEGQSPVVAISNRKLADYVCRSERSVMRALKKLVEVGLLAYKDSGNGRRFENSLGEAYGLDLSPACKRLDELRKRADDYKTHLEAERALKRKSKGLVRAINDACAELSNQGELAQAEELQQRVVAIMESPQAAADKMTFLSELYEEVLDSAASELQQCESMPEDQPAVSEQDQSACEIEHEATGNNEISIEVLAHALTMTTEHFIRPIRSWDDLRGEANSLRLAIGLSELAWQKAVRLLGLKLAAACLAVVVEKVLREPERLTRPAGYFNGMVEKGQTGDLNLNRTIWSLARRN